MSSSENSADDLLDPRCLDQLRALDPARGEGFLIRVLQTYQQSLARQEAALHQAAVARDAAAIGTAAHALKSASASVGAHSMADRCAQLEHLVQQGWHPDIDPALQGFAAEAERVRSAVQRTLETP